MQNWKSLLMVLISLLVVLTGWVYLAGMTVERTLLSSSYYRELVEETGLISDLHQQLQETLPDLIMKNLVEALEGDWSEEEKEIILPRLESLAAAVADMVDENWFKDLSLLLIDDVLAVARGEQETFSVSISLEENKEQLRGQLITALETLPADVKSELGLTGQDIASIVDRIMAEIDLPDQIYLEDLVADNSEIMNQDLETFVSTVQVYRGIYNYLPYVIFALMLLSSLLVAGFSGGLKWFGTAVLFFSITYLAAIQLLNVVSPDTILSLSASRPPIEPELLNAVIRFTVAKSSIIPLVGGAAGLIVVISGFVLGKVYQES